MNSALATVSTSSFTLTSPLTQSIKPYASFNFRPTSLKLAPIRAQARSENGGSDVNWPRLVHKLKKAAGVVFLTAATAAMVGKFPARAEAEPPMLTTTTVVEEKLDVVEEVEKDESFEKLKQSPPAKQIESSPEAIDSLKKLLVQKLDSGEDEEALKLINQLMVAQPLEVEWKYMKARLLNEMGLTDESRVVFEELLAADPLNYETLFENALLMNRCGEGEAVIKRLEEAVRVAEEAGKGKEKRDLRLMIAQMKFLQNNVDEALSDYDQLILEDGSDFRLHYSKGVIYALMKMNEEAKEEMEKYRKLAPKKDEVEAFLKMPLSRMLVFGTSEQVV